MDAQKIICAYSRFVPHFLIELLGKKDVTELQLGIQVEKKITIMFTDIRDFTSLSETLSPQENFNFINTYLSQMEPLISVNDGIVDKFIGDAIMALFPGTPDDAIACALQMQKQLKVYNEGRKRAGYRPIRVGIGINTGLAMIGTVGGYNRMDGTVISDAVNLASRIESLTKQYDVDILLSENTYHDISDTHKPYMRFIDRRQVKGKIHPCSIYELFAHQPAAQKDQKKRHKRTFEQALGHYHQKQVDAARPLLNQCLENDHGDSPAKIYLRRCDNYSKNGIHEGAYELDQLLEWSDAFLIGESTVDAQHKQLVENALALMNVAKQGERAKLSELIRAFTRQTELHFKSEEAIMDHHDYPFVEHQKSQHRYFLQSVSELEKDTDNTDISMSFLTFKIQIILVDWLLNHTLKEDKHLGRFLNLDQ